MSTRVSVLLSLCVAAFAVSGSVVILEQNKELGLRIASCNVAYRNDLSSMNVKLDTLLNERKCYWNGYSEGLSACYASQS